MLTSLWKDVGLAAIDLEAVFVEDRHLDQIQTEQNEARTRGVSGVPFFVVGGAYALSGAQDKSVFHQVFNLIDREQAA